MNERIPPDEAYQNLRKAGFRVVQLERGTLLAYKGGQSYGFTWRSTDGGKGYNKQAILALSGVVSTGGAPLLAGTAV